MPEGPQPLHPAQFLRALCALGFLFSLLRHPDRSGRFFLPRRILARRPRSGGTAATRQLNRHQWNALLFASAVRFALAAHPNSFKITTYNLIQNKPLHPPIKSITFKKQGGGGVSNRLTPEIIFRRSGLQF